MGASVLEAGPRGRAGPGELLAEHLVEGLAPQGDHRHPRLRAADLHLVSRLERPGDLAVDRDARAIHVLPDAHADLLLGADEKRAEGERMGADGSRKEPFDGGADDRTARGERIRGGSGWR